MNKYKNRLGRKTKSFGVEIKEFNAESRTISGYGAVFGNKDKDNDILVKGCFEKSIRERGPMSNANDKIIFLWMHDMSEPIGRITKLEEDERGLYFEAVLDDIERGNQALKQLESGTLNQFSIGFRYVWEKCEYDQSLDAFIVKEVMLHEISVVSIGANGETEYLGLKGLTDEEQEEKYKELAFRIDLFLKGLSTQRQNDFNMILSDVIAMHSFKACKSTLKDGAAASNEAKSDENKSIFTKIKLKDEEKIY